MLSKGVGCSLVGCLLLAAGCESADASVAGEISWTFDYKAWTLDGSDSDVRGCDNIPATTPEFPYEAITTVRVILEDPTGQVQGLDEEVDCALGEGGEKYGIQGVGAEKFDLTVQGKDADDHVIYAIETSVDLAKKIDKKLTLKAASGETRVFPYFDGAAVVGECPSNVATMKVRFFPYENDVLQETAAFTQTFDACDSSNGVETLYIRGVPAWPEPTETGGYLPVAYQMRLEAQDSSGDVSFCKQLQRNIVPGGSLNNDDVALDVGACN